ncbi:hypothetical protein OS493_023881 [Desmophyllum pertusum]|uniref:Uncharacterized protein n=1 Tax=Desmophyllum pertusum TaxID=174260 RepID=A0A9W9YAA2_9CNID|nr:hypothetical protein OS493_023881 [Desmophyllum pertusum]
MAGLNTRSTRSRSRSRRDSLEDTDKPKSLASNEQFMQLLRTLPDELVRLQRENNTLKNETKVSPSRAEENETLKQKVREYERKLQERVNISPRYSRDTEREDLSNKRIDHEKRLKEHYETREKELISKHKESVLQSRKHHEQQLNNSTEILQKNNNELQNLLNESLHIASQRAEENETLKKKVRECERQLQERVNISPGYSRDAERFSQVKQALDEKRRELDRFKERHAAFSERRVRSDQRRTENTLSSNRQSQLESEYVIEFKDGTRVDAIEVITTKIAYEVVLNVKESFATYTSSVMEILAADAPAIGSDNTTFQNKPNSISVPVLTKEITDKRDKRRATMNSVNLFCL